jgi:hypothetical protein
MRIEQHPGHFSNVSGRCQRHHVLSGKNAGVTAGAAFAGPKPIDQCDPISVALKE